MTESPTPTAPGDDQNSDGFPTTATGFHAQLPDDPRLTDEYITYLPGNTTNSHPVVLIGTVHDHPASIARVRLVLDAVTPDTIGVELPALALPWYRHLATTSDPVPDESTMGSEMTTAIRHSGTADITAIDGPSLGFFHELGQLLRTDAVDVSWSTLRTVLHGSISATCEAGAHRLRSYAHRLFPASIRTDAQSSTETVMTDGGSDPDEQAVDEAAYIRRARTLLQRQRTTPDAVHLRDTAREEYMASQLEELRCDGPVVAVIGMAHMSGITDALTVD